MSGDTADGTGLHFKGEMMKDITLGNWKIIHNPKPIPDRRFDFDVVHDEYDLGREDLQFNCGSVEEAMQGIIDREFE
jgi:hypothetical protein